MSSFPTSAQYRQQGLDNHRIAEAAVAVCPAWATVIAFYAAVHLVNAVAAVRNRQFGVDGGHAARNGWIKIQPDLRDISKPFLQLYHDSCRIRYQCPPPNDEVLSESYFRTHALPQLVAVEERIEHILTTRI